MIKTILVLDARLNLLSTKRHGYVCVPNTSLTSTLRTYVYLASHHFIGTKQLNFVNLALTKLTGTPSPKNVSAVLLASFSILKLLSVNVTQKPLTLTLILGNVRPVSLLTFGTTQPTLANVQTTV